MDFRDRCASLVSEANKLYANTPTAIFAFQILRSMAAKDAQKPHRCFPAGYVRVNGPILQTIKGSAISLPKIVVVSDQSG